MTEVFDLLLYVVCAVSICAGIGVCIGLMLACGVKTVQLILGDME